MVVAAYVVRESRTINYPHTLPVDTHTDGGTKRRVR
jgi:hypothetical protein